MLNLFQVNSLASQIFHIVQDDLFSVRHKNCDSIVLRVLLKTFFGLQNSCFNLLKAAEVNFVKYFGLNFLKVFFFVLDLF